MTFIFFKDSILNFYNFEILNKEKEITIIDNEYAKNSNYNYVQLTTDFYAKNYQHLLNIIYTIINSGNTTFTFYCSKSYTSCIDDFDKLADNQAILSDINNFVNPLNSFKKFISSYSNNGTITINIQKKYTTAEVENLNTKIDETIKEKTNSNMSQKEKVQILHDYIVNTSKYIDDEDKDEKATSILFNHQGVCSAYTDTMALFLDKLDINNYKISSESHIWNLVLINNTWYHLDTTFDDPITNTGENILLYDMFLIDTKKLLELDNKNHNFNHTIYAEAQ